MKRQTLYARMLRLYETRRLYQIDSPEGLIIDRGTKTAMQRVFDNNRGDLKGWSIGKLIYDPNLEQAMPPRQRALSFAE